MKNSFSTFELILVVIISSIVVIYSATFINELYSTNNNIQKKEIERIDILATKLFLQKRENIQEKLKYKNDTLYFEESILLEDVKAFSLKEQKELIEIYINYNDKIIQTWRLPK